MPLILAPHKEIHRLHEEAAIYIGQAFDVLALPFDLDGN
jgi:hypothetical protein